MESRLSSILQDKGYTVHTIPPDLSVYDCAKKLCELHIGALLVIDKEKLVGIISERDIIHTLIANKGDISTLKVADLMTKELLTVPPTMTVREAMRLVTEKRFRHLPVIEDDKLIGIVSIGDLTRCAMLAQEEVISSLTTYIHGEVK